MTEEQMKAMFSPFPKMSMASKGRKTIHYLQQLKDEGKKIVQHCPSPFGPLFTMAANMAGVDVVRLAPRWAGLSPEDGITHAQPYLASFRNVAPQIHINYVTDTQAFAIKEEALKNFANFHSFGADSILPMGINNDTLKFVSDNHCIIFGHVGALSGWQTMGCFGGYKKLGQTAEAAMKIFRDAYEYQENGMKAMSIELTPIEVSNAIAKKLRVPVINIAAGGECDGCETVDGDTFGLMAKPAMHAWTHASFMKFAFEAYSAWANAVRTGAYPEPKHGFNMDPAELEKFTKEIESF